MKKIKIPLVSAKTRQRESDDGQPKQQKKEGSRENKRRKDVDIN